MPKKQINLTLDNKLYEDLRKFCYDKHLSYSQAVREAIEFMILHKSIEL